MDYTQGCFVGRIWNTAQGGPCLVTIKDNYVYDITSKEIPTIRDLLELNDINEYLGRCDSAKLVSAEDLFETSMKKTQIYLCSLPVISKLLKRVVLRLLNLWLKELLKREQQVIPRKQKV